MYRYSAFSLTIDSEVELPELSEGRGEPDVIIRLGTVTAQQTQATIEDEFALPLNVGRFHVKGGREIVVDPLPDADPYILRAMLQGRLMAYLLRQRGCLPLHASGVAIGGQAVLFLGESGAGKSTTAAAFLCPRPQGADGRCGGSWRDWGQGGVAPGMVGSPPA